MDKINLRRHHELMIQFITLRRDELIDIWTETRAEYPHLKSDIDDMFAQYIERLDEQITAWDIGR